MNLFLLVITVYVLVLIGIGVYKSFQIKSQDDFMVAGRNVSMWFLVGTLVCTWVFHCHVLHHVTNNGV
ncbi:MAG TPA: hypothetical protein PL129_03330, partial [bacterium]|nr:hypothetical protein [bacterium]